MQVLQHDVKRRRVRWRRRVAECSAGTVQAARHSLVRVLARALTAAQHYTNCCHGPAVQRSGTVWPITCDVLPIFSTARHAGRARTSRAHLREGLAGNACARGRIDHPAVCARGNSRGHCAPVATSPKASTRAPIYETSHRLRRSGKLFRTLWLLTSAPAFAARQMVA